MNFKFKNILKSIVSIVLGELIFVVIITVVCLIGWLVNNNIPMKEIMVHNLELLILLIGVGIPVGVIISKYISGIKAYRMVFLTFMGLVFYWLIIIMIILILLGFDISSSDINDVLALSIWAMLAYSIFTLPLMTLLLVLLERITRRRSSDK